MLIWFSGIPNFLCDVFHVKITSCKDYFVVLEEDVFDHFTMFPKSKIYVWKKVDVLKILPIITMNIIIGVYFIP